MVRFLWRFIVGLFAATGVFAISAVLWLSSTGLSARRPPSAAEAWLLGKVQSLGVSAQERAKQDPAPAGAYAWKAGMQQFAQSCAACHGVTGSGESQIGKGLYPRPPDLRAAATQARTDGELYHVIDEGVRFSGMPAGDRGENDVWALVHFVRHLPNLTKAEIEQLRAAKAR